MATIQSDRPGGTGKNCLEEQFKSYCKEHFKKQPNSRVSGFLQEETVSVDLSSLHEDDLPFVEVMLALSINKVHLWLPTTEDESRKRYTEKPQKTFNETSKFKTLIHLIATSLLHSNSSIRSLRIEGVPFSLKHFKQFSIAIKNTLHLKELVFCRCSLTDSHLESLKGSLASNCSLVSLDLSYNSLSEVGGMVGKILSEHSRRRNEIVWALKLRGQQPGYDISSKGLCEVNLEGNRLNDCSVRELITFLKDDSWTKCLNLRANLIHFQGIKDLAFLIKTNSSLISLDLRQNQGFTKEYSRYIYQKLVLNMQRYRQIKDQFEKISQSKHPAIKLLASRKRNQKIGSAYNSLNPSHQNTGRKGSKLQFEEVKGKGGQESHRKSCAGQDTQNRNENEMLNSEQSQNYCQNNSMVDKKGSDPLSLIRDPQDPMSTLMGSNVKDPQKACHKCKYMTFRMLKLQKHNIDLQLQLKKLKKGLVARNIDISSVMQMSQSRLSGGEEVSTRFNSDNEDELLQRMEQIMLELTSIIENVEDQSQTRQANLSNHLESNHSLSNTILLYSKQSHLLELSREINDGLMKKARIEEIFLEESEGEEVQACLQ